MSQLQEIPFSKIGEFSVLPQKIESSSDNDKKFKTEREVVREFGNEKWAAVLDFLKTNPRALLRDVDEIMEGFGTEGILFEGGRFYLADGRTRFELQLDIYESFLRKYLPNASCLVELGAGYGSKILNLAKRSGFQDCSLFAFELTQTGCDAIKHLAFNTGIDIKVGHCNFNKLTLDNIKVPPGGLVFTSYALHYVPQLNEAIFHFFNTFKPLAVVNFEPCFEHQDNSIHGKMSKRYIELNDYNTNIRTVLHREASVDAISLEETINVFGNNPFLPISVFEWAKNNK